MDIEKYLARKTPLIDKAIEKYIPRRFTKSSLLFCVDPPKYGYNLETLNKAIAAPVWDMLDRGGKRWRPAMFLLIIEALGKKPHDFIDFSIIPEVVHNGTLMIDDIEDSSEVRRGKPSTYKLYGVDIAINAGNIMYYLPLLPLMEKGRRMTKEKAAQIYEIYSQEMINLGLGQAMDIAWHRGLADADTISEEDYLQLSAYKTGTLARMAAKIAAIIAEANVGVVEKIGHFAESMGIAFQIRDDVLDLTSKDFEKKKGGRGQDITEGKRSLIVIHALRKTGQKNREKLIKILNMHTSDQKLKDEAIGIMQKAGAIGYAEEVATRIVAESWKQVERELPMSHGKEKLKAFAEFLIERNI